MEEAVKQLLAKDTKERMAGVERLQTHLELSRKGLSANEIGCLVDASLVSLKDNNFRVSQGTLQALASAAALAGEHLKLHFNALLPAIVERLGDGKQPVRDAGRRLLLALMEISSPTIIVERAGNFAWAHRNWRVREEFARSVASAINLFAATELPFQRMLLPSVLHLLEDSNSSVREAAMLCLEEMYRQGGSPFRDELYRNQLRPAQLKDITGRFDKIEPLRCPFDSVTTHNSSANHFSSSGQFVIPEPRLPVAATAVRRSSPKFKASGSDTSSVGGDGDSGEKPVDPIRVHSDKELTREIEKAVGLLTPEQDWSVRIAAMQRIEGLVAGGASEYACFMALMKQLVGPLNIQLSDRRSSIVKQACHLLNLMSRELAGDFEIFAESFIPVLFKLVVITVLVIAESADTCIKTMLRNCRVSRVLPKLMECAKHDRNAVLRARCCEYALLVLEQWGDSPEIQRSVELYEVLIKCCVGDAMSEVRSSARMCFRVFSKYWPERARRIIVTFDASVQRLLNEEEGFFQKRCASPYVRDRGAYGQQEQQLKQSTNMPLVTIPHQAVTHLPLVPYSNPAPLNVRRRANASSGLEAFSEKAPYGLNSSESGSERTLESVLKASQQQVSAIENMLRGVEVSEVGAGWAGGKRARAPGLSGKVPLPTADQTTSRDSAGGGSYRRIHASSFATRVGVDAPSARDPPCPASTPVSNQIVNQISAMPAGVISGNANAELVGVNGTGTLTARHLGSPTLERDPYSFAWKADGSHLHVARRDRGGSLPTVIPAKRITLDRHGSSSASGDLGEIKGPKRVFETDSVEKGSFERGARDSNGIPGFQRPLLRQSGPGRSTGSSRSSIEENPVLAQLNAIGETHNYMEGSMSLNDALTEGLSVSADWSARVAAFTFLRKLLQQGPKGLQEINQSFGMVMKLFSAHLDDPHHKVAQAALATLAELVPACRKFFEAYLERILPHVFARLVDAKEVIRQLGTTALEIVGNTYNIESLLPALLRSLDEQRSPKARIAVIEFATTAFAKLDLKSEATGGSGLLKLWLAKLGPLGNDKNPKLKETAVTGIISVYSHFDPTTVLNFILGLSIEDQSQLRRSLKQYTPRIEVDLMTYLQNRSQRVRSKVVNDQSDTASATSETYGVHMRSTYPTLSGSQPSLGYFSSSTNSDRGRKWGSTLPDAILTGNLSQQLSVGGASVSNLDAYQSFKSPGSAGGIFSHLTSDSQTERTEGMTDEDANRPAVSLNEAQSPDLNLDTKNNSGESILIDGEVLTSSEHRANVGASPEAKPKTLEQPETQGKCENKDLRKSDLQVVSQDSNSSLSNLLHQMINWGSRQPSKEKQEVLLHLLKMSSISDAAVWSLYFDQIFAAILESMDDADGVIKELALSVIFEMLNNQRERLVESMEVLLEKLLCSTRDPDVKVCSAAERCLTVVLTEFDPYRCLRVVVPLLISNDEKTVVTSISSLTKLVSRLPSDELMAQLPSFLPALFEAFGNQSADVRKTVVFCLVDIYIVLGKAFVPYLGSLSSTQLRLVTIYANRISQARTGTLLDSSQM